MSEFWTQISTDSNRKHLIFELSIKVTRNQRCTSASKKWLITPAVFPYLILLFSRPTIDLPIRTVSSK
jgi:hypothetical protein